MGPRLRGGSLERLKSNDSIIMIFDLPPHREAMNVVPFRKTDPWEFETARGGTLSARIVEDVRLALFEKQLAPGDFLGTEKDIAERAGVSRIVARDALRSLQAMGVVEIKVGAG